MRTRRHRPDSSIGTELMYAIWYTIQREINCQDSQATLESPSKDKLGTEGEEREEKMM